MVRTSFLPLAGLMLVMAIGCQTRYMPEIVANAPDYLVVEGLLNTGEGGTSGRLSRTTKVDRGNDIIGEGAATMAVEGKDNSSVALLNQGSGIYTHPDLDLIIGWECDETWEIHSFYFSKFIFKKLTSDVVSQIPVWDLGMHGGYESI